ncbi:hypothetical protein [Streptomyces sp. NRRL F-5755]|uniref:hypothetical protein n=1 Tax=Streptomyces sp. NRRL F-5755 TaxID=1519475 RepID=UPI00133144B8|nr:hypothetical protein [Streptomyces sp. NRRL F-5755]
MRVADAREQPAAAHVVCDQRHLMQFRYPALHVTTDHATQDIRTHKWPRPAAP